MGEPAIAVHGLRKRFGDKEAVAGIDLAAAAGSFAGLVGPNGAEMQALDGRRPLRAWFSGQNIAVAMVAVPLLAAVSFGLAAVARHPLDGFLGLAVDLAGIGAGLALGDVFTVTWPYPMVKKPGNPTRGAADGYLGSAFAGMIGTLAGVAVAVAPVILAAAFTGSVPAGVRMPVLVAAAGGTASFWPGPGL